MSFKHGSKATVVVNSVTLTDFCDSAELAPVGDTAQVSAFGDTWHAHVGGLLGATFSISGSWDPTATTGPADALWSVLLGQVPVTIQYRPAGAGSGNRSYSFSALITALNEPASIDGALKFSAEFIVDGAITPSTL